jgi:hypothetical protein
MVASMHHAHIKKKTFVCDIISNYGKDTPGHTPGDMSDPRGEKRSRQATTGYHVPTALLATMSTPQLYQLLLHMHPELAETERFPYVTWAYTDSSDDPQWLFLMLVIVCLQKTPRDAFTDNEDFITFIASCDWGDESALWAWMTDEIEYLVRYRTSLYGLSIVFDSNGIDAWTLNVDITPETKMLMVRAHLGDIDAIASLWEVSETRWSQQPYTNISSKDVEESIELFNHEVKRLVEYKEPCIDISRSESFDENCIWDRSARVQELDRVKHRIRMYSVLLYLVSETSRAIRKADAASMDEKKAIMARVVETYQKRESLCLGALDVHPGLDVYEIDVYEGANENQYAVYRVADRYDCIHIDDCTYVNQKNMGMYKSLTRNSNAMYIRYLPHTTDIHYILCPGNINLTVTWDNDCPVFGQSIDTSSKEGCILKYCIDVMYRSIDARKIGLGNMLEGENGIAA